MKKCVEIGSGRYRDEFCVKIGHECHVVVGVFYFFNEKYNHAYIYICP